MNQLKFSPWLVVAIVGLLILSGCGAVTQARKAAERTQKMNQLKQLGLAYLEFQDAKQRSPNNWDELQSMAKGSPTIQEMRKQGYEVFFGVSMKDINIGSSSCIMAHNPADVATGGEVVMMDGSVMHMSADELKKALELRATIKKPE